MNRKFKIFSLATVAVLFISFSSSHPVGRSGAPGDGLCSDCHSGGTYSGSIDLTGVPSNPVPGQIYDLTLELNVSSGSPVRGGFQVVALRDANNSQAGVWSNPDNSSSLKTGSGRVYFGHEPFRNFGGNTSVSWDAEWEAPNITDDVNFYMAGILANGNGSSGGDKIVVNQLTVEITAIEMLEISFDNIISVTCEGLDDGSAEALVSGGVPPYSFEWDNGEDTAVAIALSGGSRSVTVTDSNGEQVTDSVNVPEPDAIDADITVTALSCFDSKDGSIEVDAFGGTGSLSCMWQELADDCNPDNLDAGTYFLTVTDENGCAFETEVEVTEPDPLILNMASTDASASNDDGTATCVPAGGMAPYQFAWSNLVIDMGLESTIKGLSVGEYQVTVTDANGCHEEAMVEVSGITCNIILNLNAVDALCYGDSTGLINSTVQNATPPMNYTWSNGDTTDALSSVPAGNYALTVTDANSCTATAAAQIMEPDSIFIDSLDILQNACAMASAGSISFITKGGVSPYSLMWSNGLTNDTIISGLDTLINLPDTLNSLVSAWYSLTVTDANNCMLIDSFLIEDIDLQAPVMQVEDMELFVDENGFTDILELGNLNFTIDENCAIDTILFSPIVFNCSSNLGSNNLELIVFDTNGNSGVDQFEVLVSDTIPPQLDCNNTDFTSNSCGEIEYDAPVFSDNCDQVVLSMTNGLPSGSVFPEGETIISYMATDGSGNTSSCNFTITVDTDLEVQISVTNASCTGDDGMLEIEITGGTPPYTVEPQNLSSLSAGNYNVSVIDASGCIYTEEITIFQDDVNFEYDFTTSDVNCKDGSDGSISVEINGPDPIDSYIIAIDGGQSSAEALTAGEHLLTIEASNTGCTVSQIFVIFEPDNDLEIQLSEFVFDPCTMELLDYQSAASGGTIPYMFSEEISDLAAIITVIDANGCMDSDTVEIMAPDELLNVELVNIMNADNGDNGAIEVMANGGVPPYSYEWTDALGTLVGNGPVLDGLDAGIYSLVVTDAAACVLGPEIYEVDRISSTGDIETSSNIILSPVPVEWVLNIRCLDRMPESVSVYDINGQLVYSVSLNKSEEQIDFSNMLDGIYLIRFDFDDVKIIKRIVKM